MKGETFIRSGLDVHFTVVDKVEKILPAIFAAAEPESRKVEQSDCDGFSQGRGCVGRVSGPKISDRSCYSALRPPMR